MHRVLSLYVESIKTQLYMSQKSLQKEFRQAEKTQPATVSLAIS